MSKKRINRKQVEYELLVTFFRLLKDEFEEEQHWRQLYGQLAVE